VKSKHTFRLSPEVANQLAELAIRRRVSQAEIVEAALQSFLTADGPERLEAALGRRIDRIFHRIDQLERHVDVGNEALGLFVRFWLTTSPANPEYNGAAAQSVGKERFEAFVSALARRLESTERLGG
jgi:hypothetical protein